MAEKQNGFRDHGGTSFVIAAFFYAITGCCSIDSIDYQFGHVATRIFILSAILGSVFAVRGVWQLFAMK